MSDPRIERTRLLAEGRIRKVDTMHPAIRIEEGNKPGSAWAGKRLLTVDGTPAFELSFWCGTCPFVFERIGEATRTLSIGRLTATLNKGISDIDRDVVRTVSELLATGKYLPLLLQISPTLVHPGQPEDYFTHEQVATWASTAPSACQRILELLATGRLLGRLTARTDCSSSSFPWSRQAGTTRSASTRTRQN